MGPSKDWMDDFLKRHPEVVLGRPSGLDPKRAQAFNLTTVQHYFDLLDGFLKEHEIPWENIYNMDEKGIQLGGGRKGNRTKYLFSRQQRAKLRIQNANLELVTIIECICADGTSIMPGFVFAGTRMCPEWFETEENLL